jgi:GNAT superfamily N-acetyltransferase
MLAKFGRRTFKEAFGADNDPSNMAAYLHANYGVERQAAELVSPEVTTLLAEEDGSLAGFAQVRRGTPPDCVEGEDTIELWRFYVDRPWQGTGAAQALMQSALDAALELGGYRLWLSVWERNPRAIAFYRKNGFEEAGTTSFWVGSERQTDLVLVRDLKQREGRDR